MYHPIQLKTKTLSIRNSISRSPLRCGLFLIALACFALSPAAQAVVPAPDGGYPNANTAEGEEALHSLTTGSGNTAIGYFALYSNTTGYENTANGLDALYYNTTGGANTANGSLALVQNTTGNFNTANGFLALYRNTTGNYNTANGSDALFSNTAGNYNTANGYYALERNTGNFNTANGANALSENTTGILNTATGFQALSNNITAGNNTANGSFALYYNTAGVANTATGAGALARNTTGDSNTALGYQAGVSLTGGSGNVCIGAGVFGVAGESNATRIRNIYSSVVSDRAVYVSSNNKIGTLSSSRRYKEEIKSMDKTSEALFALKPVTFRYKKEVDAARAISFGLIAEEVAEISPELITRDEQGNPQTVRYEAVNAMLLNEFLKEHRKVEKLEATVAQQRKSFEAAVAELKAQIQKVSAQLQLNKTAPQTVENNR